MPQSIQIFSEDLKYTTKEAPFHLFHKWSMWYRVNIKFYNLSSFEFTQLQRHCLLCHKIQKSEVKMSIEMIRNFCPRCWETSSSTLECDSCGNEDLIPQPIGEILGDEETDIGVPIVPENFAGSFLLDEEEIQEIIGAIPLQSLPEQSNLQLDENAVQKLLNEPFGFLTGLAGTGKTTLINEISRLHPDLFEMTATTGIAAVNLGSKTIHSTLKFYDAKSLENNWREQLLHMNLRKVRSRRKKLLIDEASMLGGKEMLDLIINAVDEINSDDTGKKLGVWLSGDMCQLPPVNMSFPFKGDYWQRFEDNTVRLTKIWRQDNENFMKGINLIRANKGIEAMKVFQSCGVRFTDKVDDNFEGTTLIPNNNNVDSYNEKRLQLLEGKLIRVQSTTRGQALKEWEKLIPVELRLKIGAYVMILTNDIPSFNYVNGDTGWIRDYDPTEEIFTVEVKRTGRLEKIGKISRHNFSDKEPPPHMFTKTFTPELDYQTGDWIIGTVKYHPIRLAYASTIHKSQGLSLDLVQVDTRQPFFGFDSMGYVSISRARTPEGLVLVGKPEIIGKKIRMNKEVLKYA